MFLISKALAATVDISIPCISCTHASSTNPVGLIADFYELALALSGVLALGMIIYAGIMRVTSANKPSSVSESNDIIFNALLGIVLLFGAYILLNTINPELTKLQIPQLSKIKVASSTASDIGGKMCYGDQFGTCALPDVQECKKGDDGKYSCKAKDNVVWGCKGKFYSSSADGTNVEIAEKWLSCMSRTLPDGTKRTKSVCDSNCSSLLKQQGADNLQDLCIQTTSDVCKINQ